MRLGRRASRSRSVRRSLTLRAALAIALGVLGVAVLPASPAAAITSISWTATPPSVIGFGASASFAWTGKADDFLGARITGCFASVSGGGVYSTQFDGDYASADCHYSSAYGAPGRAITTVGFFLSTGAKMTTTWATQVVTPVSVTTGPNPIVAPTGARGAVVTFDAYGHDSYYGAYPASCSPASGSVFPPGTTTVRCVATNPLGMSGTGGLAVTVTKTMPPMTWSPTAQIVSGQQFGPLMTAAMGVPDAAGSIVYTDESGNTLTAASILPVGKHTIIATYYPDAARAPAYNGNAVFRPLTVLPKTQSVAFATTPTTATVDDPPFSVTATGTPGGGAVTIGTTTASTCAVTQTSAGTSVSADVQVNEGGTCVLTADQAAATGYLAAPQAQRSVTVRKATPTITWATPAETVYGASLADLMTASTTVPGTWTYRLDGQPVTGDVVPGAAAGRVLDVVFTPDAPAKYTTATASRTVTVLQAPQTLAVAAIPDATYGDAPFDLAVDGDGPGAVSATASGACTVDGLTVAIVAAGTCTVTVDKAGTPDYLAAPSVTRTFAVAKAALTVTALDATTTYGAPLPALGYRVSGLRNGDTEAVFTVPPTCTTPATPASHVGTAPISCTGAAAADYDVASVDGSLTITPAALTVRAPDATRLYGAPNPPLAPAYDGFVNGDGPGALSATGTCTTAATGASPAGTYPVTCSGAAARDYVLTARPGSLVVGYAFGGFLDPLDGTATLKRNAAVPVRFQLLDASGAAIPSALAKGIDAGCRATLATSSGGAAAVERGCARLTGDHFQLNLATKDLPLGATVLTIVVRAEDGTVAARQSVTVTLR